MQKKELFKGIFWIKFDDGDSMLFEKIPVHPDGTIINPQTLSLNSKKNNNYNHQLTWSVFDSKKTEGKSFDYYPRGRIEIKRNKATIYANPYICRQDIIEKIMNEFGLNASNGIENIRCIPDYSEHYRCYLDK